MKDEEDAGRILEQPRELRQVLEAATSLAVIGMKGPGEGAAFSVPKFMGDRGYEIFPINPTRDHEILGRPTVESVDELPEPVDLIVIFRRSDAVGEHVDEILSLDWKPDAVWMQLGIRNQDAAARLCAAGIDVIQDHCIKVEYQRLI